MFAVPMARKGKPKYELPGTLLGHGTVATTEVYLGRPTMDELRDAIAGFEFRSPDRTPVLGFCKHPILR